MCSVLCENAKMCVNTNSAQYLCLFIYSTVVAYSTVYHGNCYHMIENITTTNTSWYVFSPDVGIPKCHKGSYFFGWLTFKKSVDLVNAIRNCQVTAFRVSR